MSVSRNKSAKKKPVQSEVSKKLEEGGSKLPFERDACFVRETPVPPPTTERVIHNVTDGFRAEVVKTMMNEAMAAFYGSRFKPQQIVRDTELALDASAVQERLQHGADRARQIAEAPMVRLMEQAAIVVRDYDDLIAEHPELADGLQDLMDWWTATFPGGGPKPKSNPNGGGDTKGTGASKNGGDAGSGTSGGDNGGSPSPKS